MAFFLIFYIVLGGFLIIRSKYRFLCNEMFYLGMFWLLIFGTYLFSGVIFRRYGMSVETVIFIVISAVAFLFGRRNGKRSKVKVYVQGKLKGNTGIFIFIGLLGVVLFVFDLFRLNGLMLFLDDGTGKNNEYELSIIGAVGSLLIPVLFVEGLYLLAEKLKYEKSFSILGIFLLIGYSVPCILNNGRESLAYVLISMVAVYGYFLILTKRQKNKLKIKDLLLRSSLILVVASFVYILFNISSDRFGQNEINTFLLVRDVSSEAIKEGQKWGEFEFLYYNIISYFSHQISFLDFTLKEYDGPYLFGMYELNIISRRLPEFLGLDYNGVYDSLERLYSSKGVSYSGAWFTVLGSFICDFGRIGTILVCYYLGFVLGKVRRKFESTYDTRYAVLVAIICATSFTTIQLGPFYNTLVYGAFIWWMIIFMHGEIISLPKLSYN